MGIKITIDTDDYLNENIMSANVFMVESLAGDELQTDTLTAEIDMSLYQPVLLSPSDKDGFTDTANNLITIRPWIRVLVADPSSYSYGTVVKAYNNDVLLGKFYMTGITRVGKYLYSIQCMSPVGLLDNSTHYGGVYGSNPSITMAGLLDDIIGGVIPYTLNPALANQMVRGWLPVDSRRNNLHKLLFAMGASIKKDADGDVYITALDADTTTNIPDSRIYTGGKNNYQDNVSAVTIAEHAYISRSDDDTVTLYDGDIESASIVTPNGTTTTGGIVLFDNPAHDLEATGATIIESGANYAVLSAGSGVLLTGKKHTHTVRQITRPTTATADDLANVTSVEDDTLISLLNSASVADRVYSYYSSARTVDMDIIANEERPGDAVEFNDPFDESTTGLIASMGIDLSSTSKATTNIVVGYTPTSGNTYNNVAIITANSTWTVPDGVDTIKVVLVGGGDGGASGGNGTAGGKAANSAYGAAGTPGQRGTGGNGGKIKTAEIEVTAGDTATIVIGTGGYGGVHNNSTAPVSGALGGDTTLFINGDEYTTEDGQSSYGGYTELLYGGLFGVKGNDGIMGGSANPNGTNITWDGTTYAPGVKGASN